MANSGTWPIDATTDIGMFRFQVGDVVGTPTSTGLADFEFMSDATIGALLAEYPTDYDIAKGVALQSMATQLITSAQDIQVDDIRIKTVERAKYMADLAANFGVAADGASAASAFEVVPLTASSNYQYPWAQGQPRRTGPSGF